MLFKKKFEDILSNGDFADLFLYTDPKLWGSMTEEERELLGLLLIKQGEKQLSNGDNGVVESFKLASEIAPKCPRIFFRQGLIYASQETNIRCLISASEAFEKAALLDPVFVNAWHAWGNVLVRLGVFYQENGYFQAADEKFKEVEKISLKEGCRYSENFYWHWGVSWFYQGKHSGEPADYFYALAKFQQAISAGFEDGDFYNDYGNVLVELGCLLGRKELFYEAINFYKKAVKLIPERYEGWLNLACTYHRLYELIGNEENFRLADESFEKATQLNPNSLNAWLRWGEHYANSGKIHKNAERLRLSFEKFEKASLLEPDHPSVLLHWGEAQMLWASQMENFDQLHESESKISRSLESCPENPNAWYIYGTCLSEFGRYFEDEEYYFQAIEKFQYGLSLSQSHALLWYGLALSHFALGELRSDVSMIEKSVRFCSRVIEFEGQAFPDFWNDWGVALLKLGEMTNEKKYLESAIEKFEQAMVNCGERSEHDIGDLEYFYNYGCAWDFLGDMTDDAACYEKAIQVLSYVLQHDQNYTHARYNLALALSHLGELNADVESFQRALILFQEVLREDSEDEMAWNDWGQTLLNLAFLTYDPYHQEYGQKLYEQAENKLLHAAALGCVQAFYNLACLYSLIENYPAAMHYLERAQLSDSLPPVEDVMHDEWLEGLRDTYAFKYFISQIASEQEKEK